MTNINSISRNIELRTQHFYFFELVHMNQIVIYLLHMYQIGISPEDELSTCVKHFLTHGLFGA